MGFYGNITNTSRTQFQFDKIYPNRVTMDNNAKEDNIYIGRYVLIEYDSSFGRDWADIVYQKNENEFYTSPNFEEETKLNLELLKNTYIRVRSTLIDIIYYINDEAEPIKISELSQEFNSYTENYNIDIEAYGPGRGYDSTVWQKTFVNGVEKYVMIAELNTIVPTFDVSADAPTMAPITPHFDADSTNVYYKLHWQPVWGLRVKAANPNITVAPTDNAGNEIEGEPIQLSEAKISLPSDEEVVWSRDIYDSSTNKTKTLYYVPDFIDDNTLADTGRWSEKQGASIPAAIYYNKAGFNSKTISHIDREDSIQIEATGLSGNEYNVHGSKNKTAQVDTQELSIILPSIGNSISDMWDIVYGNKEINPSLERNRDIQWREADVDVKEKEKGLRLVTTSTNGYSYNPNQVNTLAGVINSVHDLMGMIIKKDDIYIHDEAPVNEWRSDFIYYLSKEEKFYRKAKKIGYNEVKVVDKDKEYEEIEISSDIYKPNKFYYYIDGEYRLDSSKTAVENRVYYKKNRLYVISDSENRFITGYEWNYNIPCPEGVSLGTIQEEWQLKELTGFAKNYNTIHGLILRLNELLDKEDINNLLVQDLLNKFNALTPKAILGTDELGQLTSIELTGNDWINIVEGNKINHTQKEINPEVESKEENLEFGESFTLTSLEIGYDKAGHIDTYKTNEVKYTLPSIDYNHESFINLENSVKEIETDVNGLTTSVDSLEETLAGYGDIESSIETINEIKNINYSVDLASNEKIKSISQKAGKVNVEVETTTPKSILGFTPVQQGSGTNQGDNKVYIGWASDSTGLKVQVENTDLGYISTTSGNGPALPINKGGTGAKNALDAITNLKGVPVINAQGASYDMNTILDTGVYGWYKFNVNTLNTAYKEGVTSATAGYILNIPTGKTEGTRYGTQFAVHTGDNHLYCRSIYSETPNAWRKILLNMDIIPIGQGGTGATDAATARSNLGITPDNIGAAPATHNQSASTITSGTLSANRLPTVPVTKGGTGATDAATARANLEITPTNIGAATAIDIAYTEIDNITTSGLYRLTGTSPGLLIHLQWDINFAYQIRNLYSSGNTTTTCRRKHNGTWSAWETLYSSASTIPVANGGTGATDAATARTNLDVYSKSETATAINNNKLVSNLLDNSDFTNPVNQRGLTTYNQERLIDRWYRAGSGILQIINGGITIQSAGADSHFWLSQTFDKSLTANKKYTVYMEYTDGSKFAVVRTPDDSGATFNISAAVHGRLTTSGISFVALYGNVVSIKYVALYEGEIAAANIPKYVSKGYGAELAQAMRYYQTCGEQTVTIMTDSGGNVVLSDRLPIPMKSNPTLSAELKIKKPADDNFTTHSGSLTTTDPSNTIFKMYTGGYEAKTVYIIKFKYSASCE